MSGFLLDTNVFSEPQKRRRHHGVIAWLAAQNASQLFVSTLTIGENRRGIELLRTRDHQRAERIGNWLATVEVEFGDRVIPFTSLDAHQWGQLTASGPTLPLLDAQLAAVALARGLVVATRNVSDFQRCGVDVVNPFEFQG
ncbi:MAG: type II toxin-antitoxin system VapC family toxin [Cellulomonadaceae bacterium]|nr:type II toxin-antitoxin system VapC family toxin [Cellulomonadaceae bacterium]